MLQRLIKKEESKLIANKYRRLLNALNSNADDKEHQRVRRAFILSLQVHQDHRRKTGEFYFIHAVDVATIVAGEMSLGPTSVVAALLQDISHEGNITISGIEKRFGVKVARIVSGLDKISNLHSEKISLHPENFIKLMMSVAGDVRVILIRLANRLHFMRVLDTLTYEHRKQIALETSNLHAPIAHRLGLHKIKQELEQLSMQYSDPEIYTNLKNKLEAVREDQQRLAENFIKPIRSALQTEGFEFVIKGRLKSISSIWRKMQNNNVDFEEIYDMYAIRIILKNILEDEKSDCWRAYSLVTNIYLPNPNRLRDWISSPKRNGYESLHTTVHDNENRWIEVQIRTSRMHEEAERGIAAHWKYKAKRTDRDPEKWLRKIREVLENPDPEVFENDEISKMKVHDDKIFVFTPQGDLKKLSTNSTVLDFAFAVHTNVGLKCSGGKVNDNIVPIRHQLKNGDKVEIITSRNQKPNKDWLAFMQSSRARSKVKRAIQKEQYSDADIGRDMLIRKLSQLKLKYTDELVSQLITHFKFSNALELYQAIASENIDISHIKEFVIPPAKAPDKSLSERINKQKKPTIQAHGQSKDLLMIEDQTVITDYELAKCCAPVFGDTIFGFVTVGEGIKIHRKSCPNAAQMRQKYSYRIVKARWIDEEENASYAATIRITGKDKLGIITEITQIITTNQKVNMQSISANTKGKKFECITKLIVRDTSQLEALLHKLSKVNGVEKATRISQPQ